VFPSEIDHKPLVVTKANKLLANQFERIDFNKFKCNCINITTKQQYCHYIRVIYRPYYCDCSTFLDLAYCHHILAINKLELAKIVLDLTYVHPAEPRRLIIRK